ncbi:MAG: hydroxymethylbilane synthase [Planctomycetaceae bacterium]
MTAPRTLRIASRASALALWQARHVASLLAAVAPDTHVEIVHITTTGDSNQVNTLRSFGGQGVFTREVQRAVLDERADLAVHSLKDLPTQPTPGLQLAGVPPRAPTADALIAPANAPAPLALEQLPPQARVGTGSLRRQAQLLHLRPDLRISEVRGNVGTRLRKLDEGEYDALVLATAGLQRLELAHRISLPLQPPVMFGAVGQGALGIECREDSDVTLLLDQISCPLTRPAVVAERALLATLRAGCHAPVGVDSRVLGASLRLNAVVLNPTGTERLLAEIEGPLEHAPQLGARLAQDLLAQGADRLIHTTPAPSA